ncbi:MAG: ABC transporter permease [Anaerolineae bacterium]|nr:ABC transporter permease [Anaerolineae bacterium]
MIGQLAEFSKELWGDFATTYGLLWLIALAISGGAGWLLGQRLALRWTSEDIKTGWMAQFPGQAAWLLAAIVLPFLTLPWVVMLIVLGVLLLPTVTLLSLRVHSVHHDDPRQQEIDWGAALRASWHDTAFVSAAFLVSGVAELALVPPARDSVADQLENIPLALVVALIGGSLIGLLFSTMSLSLNRYITQRQDKGDYGKNLAALSRIHGFLTLLPSQFHGTPLTGVLIVSAAVSSFTTLSQTGVLTLLLTLPVISAFFAAQLVDDPQPNQPDEWHHWRLGLMNVMQICVGYMVGTAMLIPLEEQHTWMLSDSDEVIRHLTTHLELTFLALGISMVVGIVGGIVSSRVEVLRTVLINLGNVGRTIPSLAVLALALPIFGVGRDPSLVALMFIGALPILVNTSVGIISVPDELKEAARGMGMQDWQVLFSVEIPVAIPVIMAGIRTSAVLVVASATLAGFIGGGGLGALIIRGDGSGRDDILITGAVLATILSVFLEYFFGWLEILLTPRGLRET